MLVQARDVWGQVSAPVLLRVSQETVRNRVIIFAHGEDAWSGAEVAGSLAQYAKEVALLRRVREQDVKVIADGVFAVGGAPEASAAALQDAIETWANADGQLGALTVFAVGQGSQNGFTCANGDEVTPPNLKAWLDTLQESSGSMAQLIVDSDYSGRFVAGSGSGNHRRIVISSTGPDTRNTFASGYWTGVTRWIWSSIARGRDLRESYGDATDLAGRINVTVPALFDDNGDGRFSRLRDGLKAINAFVGSAYVTADDPPFIGKASAAMAVPAGEPARFWVSNIVMPDGEAPASVWCEILGPDGSSRGGNSLWYNPVKERYEGSFANFSEAGLHLVFVQAGTQGDPARTTPPAVILVDYDVIADHGSPITGALPALALPLDGQTMDVETDAGGEWRLPLKRGQRVVVEAREVSAARDVELQLIGDGGRVLATADAWGGGFGEAINGWEAPSDGNYLVRATFAVGNGAATCKVRSFIKRDAGADGFVVLPGQSITFNPPTSHPFDSGNLTLSASSSSGLPVRFEVTSGPAIITGTSLTSSAAGSVTLRAYQDGDATWQSAVPVERTLTISAPTSADYTAWAQEIFGADYATKGGLDQDADGDGQSNHLEWLAHTDPLDAADKFKVSSITRDDTGFKIRWLARSGVNYKVCWTSDLATWHDLTTSYTGTGAEAEVTDSDPPQAGRFYRVEVITP